jgi:hypothetical protein
MNVRLGPETVFDVPVDELFTELSGAAATGLNGRVGNEFVFWGYRLSNGREGWLYACALVDEVDCPQRRSAVCDGDFDVIAERLYMGSAVRRRCNDVGIAGIGELHPGCIDSDYVAPLSIGVVACSVN